jgi:hypothetical protein
MRSALHGGAHIVPKIAEMKEIQKFNMGAPSGASSTGPSVSKENASSAPSSSTSNALSP